MFLEYNEYLTNQNIIMCVSIIDCTSYLPLNLGAICDFLTLVEKFIISIYYKVTQVYEIFVRLLKLFLNST